MDVEKIVIGGGISSQPIVIKTIKRLYQELLSQAPMYLTFDVPEIETCHFLNDAGIYGALYYLLDTTSLELLV